jgi:hypothetical protein
MASKKLKNNISPKNCEKLDMDKNAPKSHNRPYEWADIWP